MRPAPAPVGPLGPHSLGPQAACLNPVLLDSHSIQRFPVQRDQATNRHKGFAYVEMADLEVIPNVLLMDKQVRGSFPLFVCLTSLDQWYLRLISQWRLEVIPLRMAAVRVARHPQRIGCTAPIYLDYSQSSFMHV